MLPCHPSGKAIPDNLGNAATGKPAVKSEHSRVDRLWLAALALLQLRRELRIREVHVAVVKWFATVMLQVIGRKHGQINTAAQRKA